MEEKQAIARILLYGDMHLLSENYGNHRNYPEESLTTFSTITKIAEREKATHIIGLGDLTQGLFKNLSYRKRVEEQLQKQFELTEGRRWEIKGNHDSATYGDTEYEYYVYRKLIRPSENLTIGKLNITMVDNGKIFETPTNIDVSNGCTNIILQHDYSKFSDSALPNYGEPIILDNLEQWYGADYIISGHIHNEHIIKGNIKSCGISKEVILHYLPCLNRLAYTKDSVPDTGHVVLLTVYDNGEVQYTLIEVELLPIEESFNIELIESKKEKKDKREQLKVNIDDIINELDKYERVFGDPIEVIMAKETIDAKYRDKAIDLLNRALM